MPEAPIWSDVRSYDGAAWRGLVDGIVAGYPCQPFSVAGRRRGFDDPRNLWPSIERIIGECRPAWCFFENVAGHLRLGYFDHVRPRLEALGYRVSEQICKASDVGSPQLRERVFILAVANAGFVKQRGGERVGGISAFGPSQTGHATRRSEVLAAFPPGPDDGRGWVEALEAHPWLSPHAQSAIRGVVDGPPVGLGISRPEQIRILGNSVVPQQAALAWQLLWRDLPQERKTR